MFGKRLRDLRTRRGFHSQQALADALGVAQSTVANWEAGRREPDFALTVQLADCLQASVDYLLGRTDDPQGGAVSDAQVQTALWGEAAFLTESERQELWDDVREYADYRLRHYRRRS